MTASIGERTVIFTGQGEFSWDDFCDHTEEQKVVVESASTLHGRVTWSSATVITGVLALIFASQISQLSFLANSNFKNYFTEKTISILGKGLALLGAIVMQWQAKEIREKSTIVSLSSNLGTEEVEAALSSQIEESKARVSTLEEVIRKLGARVLGGDFSQTEIENVSLAMEDKLNKEVREKQKLIQVLEFENSQPTELEPVIAKVIELVRIQGDAQRLAEAVGLDPATEMGKVVFKVETMVAELAKNNKESGKPDKIESRSRSSSAGSGRFSLFGSDSDKQPVPSSPTSQRTTSLGKPPAPTKK